VSVVDYFPRIERDALRLTDARGHIDILYESGTSVLKRTFSRKGVFRGMHWQAPPAPQVKLFRVVEGSIADFVIDMDDPERAMHHSVVGSSDGWVRIAANLAHGFYAFDDCVFEYFCDGGYDEAREVGFNVADEVRGRLNVDALQLSAKDAAAPPLRAFHPAN
jgi:dTDP-4-dehydrorhamnose 3,5-epimerase